MTDYQIRQADILADIVIGFSSIEMSYFDRKVKTLLYNTNSTNGFGVTNIVNPQNDKSRFRDTTTMECNPNHFLIQDILSSLTPFIASGYFTGGSGGGSTPSAVNAGKGILIGFYLYAIK